MSNSNRKSRKMCLMAMALTAACWALSADAAEKTAPGTKLLQDEAQAREQEYKRQDEALVMARDFARSRKYKESVEIYDHVIQELTKMAKSTSSHITQERLRVISGEALKVRRAWSKEVLQKARFALSEDRYHDAVILAQQVITTINKEDAAKATEIINVANRKEDAAERAQKLTLNKIDDTMDARQKDIKRLLAEAETFYRAGRYEEARNRVEKVYLLNPYDQRAIVMMDKIFRDYLTYGEKRKDATVEGGYAYAHWSWAEPVFGSNRDEKLVVAEKSDNGELLMQKKLERIIFPDVKIRFNKDNDLRQLIKEKIEKHSKTFDPEGEGVAIEFHGSVGKLKPGLHDKEFSMKQVPLSEYLRYFSLLTGIPYRVTSDRILFGSEVNRVQRQQFQVRSHLITTIAEITGSAAPAPAEGEEGGEGGGAAAAGGGAAAAAAGGGEGEGEGEGESEGAKVVLAASSGGVGKISPAQLQKYFVDRGIPFGPGCSISYDTRLGRLTVRNTLENLRRIDEMLRQLDAIKTPLVMIEIKCIQISENDVQELGFDWSLSGTNVGSKYSVIAGSTAMGTEGNQVTDGSTAVGALVQGVAREVATRGNEAITGLSNTAVLNQLNIFPALFGTTHPFGGDVAFNLFLTINALSRNTRTESMATPKIITTPGTEASIKMVKKMYFPEDWDTYEIETNQGGEPYIKQPVPTFADDPEEIGVTFRINEISINPDGRTIQMHLMPNITQYVKDDEYFMNVRGYWRYSDGKTQDTLQTFKVTQPVFTRRELDVWVNVYDGETLVLGGMVENQSVTRNDKIPILGDLPYIGRFFQTQAENTTRSNLILFVTTRLINNDGIPILRNQQNGLPDFNR